MKYFKLLSLIILGILILTTCKKPNTPPNADFTINPLEGNTDSVFTFDASLCSDDKDDQSTLQVHWDWENDGNWDTDFSTHKIIEHQYSKLGIYTIILEVKDVEGLINSIEKTLNVTASLPVVSTDSIINITSFSAQGGGNVTKEGSSEVTVKGICWNTKENPDLINDHTNEGTGSGFFTSILTNLSPNTKYYVRAYATSIVGTSFGNQVSFTTEATLPTVNTSGVINISSNSAQSGGNITSDGGSEIVSRGICWGIEENINLSNSHTLDGNSIGEFISVLTNLSPYKAYFVRAYATNEIGTTYGDVLGFRTKAVIPSVVTNIVTNITHNSAQGGGEVIYDGGFLELVRGLCWDTNENPNINSEHTIDGQGIGTFTSSLENLNFNTNYYIRAYATNPAGTSYGEQVSFKTEPTLPTLETNIITDITINSAKGGGNITSDGGANITDRGICWDTNENPDISNNHTIDGTGLGNFISTLTNLSSITTYYVRAFATNRIGTSYGQQVSFTTKYESGTLTDYRDGKLYSTVKIGDDWWMAENLNFGNLINHYQNQSNNGIAEKYCYNDLESNCDTYGGFYQQDEIMNYTIVEEAQGLCPDGWHIPSDTEWKQLEIYLGMDQNVANSKGPRADGNVGEKLKSSKGWSYGGNGTNLSGFNALPSGLASSGGFVTRESDAYFWMSSYYNNDDSRPWYRQLRTGDNSVWRLYINKKNGFSIRCIKD